MSVAFDPHALRDRLARFPAALQALASTASAADARWKPAPEHWSILEACCHLLDEEREDFRVRIESTLADPTAALLARVHAIQGLGQILRRQPEAALAAAVEATLADAA
ncbi:MAG: hypothetical protein ACO31E_04915, partial [Phycisphaerales bacterium]